MTAHRNLFLRNDTMLGVCQGLGEEFGFNPTWLRLALAFGVLWNPPAVVAIYLALGAALALGRWLAPLPSAATAAPAAAAAPVEAAAPAGPHLAAEQAPAAASADPRRLAA